MSGFSVMENRNRRTRRTEQLQGLRFPAWGAMRSTGVHAGREHSQHGCSRGCGLRSRRLRVVERSSIGAQAIQHVEFQP